MSGWGESLTRSDEIGLVHRGPAVGAHMLRPSSAIEIPVLEPLGGIRMPAGLPAHCSSAPVRDDSTARSSRPDGAHRDAEKGTDSLRDLGLCLP